MIIEDAINVFTDGSSYQNPRSGGQAIRIVTINVNGDEEYTDIPLLGHIGATNNQMELLACINGLREAKNISYNAKRIAIFTDSTYVVKNKNNALFNWQRNGWRNYNGRPIQNAQLWKDLVKEIKSSKLRVEIHWIKGKSNAHTKSVDKLAKKSAKGTLESPLTIVKLRRKKSSGVTEVGSVKLHGQKLSIYIITDELMTVQHCFKYRYQVISKKSPFLNKIDFIFSSVLLNAGHSYYVLMNKDNSNPQIVKMFHELVKKKDG